MTEALAQQVGIAAELADTKKLVEVPRVLTGTNDAETFRQLRMVAEQGDPDVQIRYGHTATQSRRYLVTAGGVENLRRGVFSTFRNGL